MGKVPNYFKSAQKELLSLGGKLIDKMKDYDKDNIPTKVRDLGVPAVPSRRRRASSPSEKAMGGLWSEFGPVRTASRLVHWKRSERPQIEKKTTPRLL